MAVITATLSYHIDIINVFVVGKKTKTITPISGFNMVIAMICQ